MRPWLIGIAAIMALAGTLADGSAAWGQTSRPAAGTEGMAVPTPEKALEVAAAAARKPLQFGQPKSFDLERGLALDKADPRTGKVVAYVGPSWIVPVKQSATAPAGAPQPAFIIDKGTGVLVARAADVVPIPKLSVVYIDMYQLAANALEPTDAVDLNNQGSSTALALRLDLGGGSFANLTIQPGSGSNPLYGGAMVKVQFGKGTGRMVIRQVALGQIQATAVNDDGSLVASLQANKGGPKLEQRLREVLKVLDERPNDTIIWPAEARPTLAFEGWGAPTYGSGDMGVWHPQTRGARPAGLPPGFEPPGMVSSNTQVMVAAKVMHPYEMPPNVLTEGIADGKVLESKYTVLDGWVGTDKVAQCMAAPRSFMPMYSPKPVQPPQALPCQVRVLDLHRDVRRVIIRCQSPRDEWAKYAPTFEKILKDLRLPAESMESVVVPLEPATYKSPKK